MKSNQRYVQEYVRVMNSVDVSEEMTERIIDKCLQQMPENDLDFKIPAIAAISCAAVAAVGKIKRNSHRK